MRATHRALVLGAASAWVAAGCALTPVDGPAAPPPPHVAAKPPPLAQTLIRQVSAVEPAPLALDELLALTRTHNPDLAAATARVGEAQGMMIQAGLYPNPTVGYAGSQINDGPGTAGQQTGYATQEFVTAGKLRVAREAGRYGVSAADWQAASRWFDTAARVKSAYYEYLTARAVLRETERMEADFTEALRRTEKLAAGGRVDSYDVSRLRVEVTQIANRVGNAKQRANAAEKLLAVAVGVPQLSEVASGELPAESAVPPFEEAVAYGSQSSFVMSAAAEAEQARVAVRQAELKPIPNVEVMGVGGHNYATRAPTASVQVGVPLPVWDRNQGNILAANRRFAAALAGVESARLRASERLTNAYQRYENARRQLDLYRTKVIPDAVAAVAQIDKVYEGKGERFFDTLDARRVLAQARIDYAQAVGDLWAAVAEIEAIIQR